MGEEFIGEEFVKKYHKKCKKLNPSALGEIGLVQTIMGQHMGFIFKDKPIFWDEDSLTMVIQEGEEIREIG